MKKIFNIIASIIFYSGIYLLSNVIAGLIVIFAIIISKFIDPNISEFINDNLLHSIMLLSIIISVSVYFLVFTIKKRNFIEYLGFKRISKKNIIWTSIAGFASYVFISIGWIIVLSNEKIMNIPKITETFDNYSEIVEPLMKGNILFIILIVGIVVPIFEEILFRGLIFNKLRSNMNIYLALILQAILFGIFHMNIIQGIYTFLLAIIIGLTFIWLKSIWAPIIIHVIFNSLNFVLEPVLQVIEKSNLNIIISLIISVFLIILSLYKIKTNVKNEELSLETA